MLPHWNNSQRMLWKMNLSSGDCQAKKCKCRLKKRRRIFLWEWYIIHFVPTTVEKIIIRRTDAYRDNAWNSYSVRSELHKFDDHTLESKDIRSIAQSLYRERRKIYPVLPKSRDEVHHAIELMDMSTCKEENFVIMNDAQSGIVIFSCISNLEFLVNSAEGLQKIQSTTYVKIRSSAHSAPIR